jgi:hypothetical protein
MRSTVHLTDRLTNAERRFGSADAYVPVRVKLADGTEAVALMTDAPFLEGIARGQANPEDVERAEAIAQLRAHQAAKAARAAKMRRQSNALLVLCALLAVAVVWGLVVR